MERESKLSGWLRRRSRGAESRAEEAARAREALLLGAAAAGFPLAVAAHPEGYGCSCERIGCPTPARHPVSFAWLTQASSDPETVLRWARGRPQANFITATGITHDVLDVPHEAGRAALERLDREGVETGPVAVLGEERMLFFTATRGTPEDEDEWWPCELDCHPETMDEHPGMRWHCRGSYVLLPPARLPGVTSPEVAWVRAPERPLPDPLTLLEALTDACAAYADSAAGQDVPGSAAWPVR
ncbi:MULTISPECIES: bifunctional DNA primase/polymerase [unclassified Streptomyces]|uniref:bifunctional DNA primase/polymerase n=1 Tax=unclassified Streptomyces TaxID=2593676 RepID=UPI0022B64F81|nr:MULTISPECIES: bifunctional DNA primase/polymerase [unclassified Streptomyces]MCZ7414004.1 bifunctional DNA primase/polymerase [Streptomyces sp. WMMC897]MCZ7430999.1 bifunctional DNA primase/polymerase [Streptomyces sp. WMMC1477]